MRAGQISSNLSLDIHNKRRIICRCKVLTFVIISCFSKLEIRYGICVNLTLQNVLLLGLEKMHVKSHELNLKINNIGNISPTLM